MLGPQPKFATMSTNSRAITVSLIPMRAAAADNRTWSAQAVEALAAVRTGGDEAFGWDRT